MRRTISFSVRLGTAEAGIVYKNGVPRDSKRIVVIRDGRIIDQAVRRNSAGVRASPEPLLTDDTTWFGGQAVWIDEHPRRTDR